MKKQQLLAGLSMILIVNFTGVSFVTAEDSSLSISAGELAEAALETESPEYKAMNDQQRIAVISRWAAEEGGFDKELLLLVLPIAERNNAEAQYVMGMIYRSPSWRKPESGIEQNPTRAHEWFLKAAKQGHSFAAVQAADDFFWGDGAAKDLDEALRWYEVAAKANDPYAQRMTGHLYLKRSLTSGNEQDVIKGIEWLQKAADNGDEEAKRLLSLINQTKPPSEDR
jgi:TPR repeat protein